ncbi:MAG: hypothetical protein FWG11_01350 [Promicromonosporaceae bacterium]|nr:hypothetical protein [Promicromonosporaceae bacterium]
MTARRLQRLTEVFREAYRNLTTGTTRPIIALTAFALLVGASGFAQARGVVGVSQAAERWVAQGSAVQIITLDGRIDGRQCDALADVPGVEAAGAVRRADPLRPAALPSVPVNVFDVTPGLSDVLTVTAGPGQAPGGVWLAADFARVVGIASVSLPLVAEAAAGQAGRWSDAGAAPVSGVFTSPAGGQSSPLDYSILSPTAPVGPFDSCWALLWPESGQTMSLLALTTTVTSSEDVGLRDSPRIAQLNTTAGTEFNAARRLTDLPTWPLTIATVCLAAALGFGLTSTRKLELASSLHAGVRKPSLLLQATLESGGWLLPAAALALAASFYAAHLDNPDPWWLAFYPALRTTVLAALAAWVCSLVAVALVREKHLFRHFKQR